MDCRNPVFAIIIMYSYKYNCGVLGKTKRYLPTYSSVMLFFGISLSRKSPTAFTEKFHRTFFIEHEISHIQFRFFGQKPLLKKSISFSERFWPAEKKWWNFRFSFRIFQLLKNCSHFLWQFWNYFKIFYKNQKLIYNSIQFQFCFPVIQFFIPPPRHTKSANNGVFKIQNNALKSLIFSPFFFINLSTSICKYTMILPFTYLYILLIQVNFQIKVSIEKFPDILSEKFCTPFPHVPTNGVKNFINSSHERNEKFQQSFSYTKKS